MRSVPVLALLLAMPALSKPATHQDLVALFNEWRTFQKPPVVTGVPDYRPAAMAAKAKALPGWIARLDGLDRSGFTVPQQHDAALVRAEMMGMDFDLRVLQPWAKDPAFFVTVFADRSDQPLREGPWADGAVELWQLTFPLSAPAAGALAARLAHVPGLLAQARTTLTGNGKDLWRMAPGVIREQVAALEELAPRVKEHPALVKAVSAAVEATRAYAAWVEKEAARKTGPGGVGKENYDWYLANVALVPFTWAEQVTLMERELDRARASLALEELRNRNLPPLEPVTTVAEHDVRFEDALATYLAFLKDNDFITWKDWMEPALRTMPGTFNPRPPLEFFWAVEARDPLLLRLHMWHFVDIAVLEKAPHPSPIRNRPALYNIFASRTEGVATALEELMLQAGLYDRRPRSRELAYVMLAQRAARALGDLRMHANEWTLEQAAEFASARTPRNWLRLDGRTVRGEQHLYLRQPAYGTSYVIGKIQLDQLLSRIRRDGPVPMKRLLDGLNATGLLPMSLVVKELESTL